uniref:SH3 domain-binding protein 5 homolog n=1 Tax=Cacopsylla melanoneura TaxID=428564 RepID=A0A8D8RI98_9HEMI
MSEDVMEPYNEEEEPISDPDPRIQIELEMLNTATDDINKLEMELDESNTTFRMLMNESTRRLKILNRKLGSCIERARPYHEALEVAKQAQQECQKAAVKFQRANEIHQAAKETVALAEARFLSKQHEWKFDSAWQDMLNNAIIKVTDAENAKSESGREHQKKATLFHAAETKVQLLEQRLKRNIVKSRPYFEEKALCEGQLNTQKARVLQLRELVKAAKANYAASLRRLEDISEEIHTRRRRESMCDSPPGPREPGVGAELSCLPPLELPSPPEDTHSYLDVDFDLDKCDVRSLGGSSSVTNSSRMSYDSGDESSSSGMNQEDLEKLRLRVRELATSPGTEGWENELNSTVNKMDSIMLRQECDEELRKQTEALKQMSNSPTSPTPRQKSGAESFQVLQTSPSSPVTSFVTPDACSSSHHSPVSSPVKQSVSSPVKHIANGVLLSPTRQTSSLTKQFLPNGNTGYSSGVSANGCWGNTSSSCDVGVNGPWGNTSSSSGVSSVNDPWGSSSSKVSVNGPWENSSDSGFHSVSGPLENSSYSGFHSVNGPLTNTGSNSGASSVSKTLGKIYSGVRNSGHLPGGEGNGSSGGGESISNTLYNRLPQSHSSNSYSNVSSDTNRNISSSTITKLVSNVSSKLHQTLDHPLRRSSDSSPVHTISSM